MTRELRCSAGHVVGVLIGPPAAGIVSIQHRGRRIICYGVIVIECDCEAVWRPDPPWNALADLEVKAQAVAGRP